MKKIKVYVACALTSVPDAERSTFSKLVDDIKGLLTKEGFEVIDFLSKIKINPEPKEVYSFDINCLNKSDCVLVIGDHPGTGLGYEIAYAIELRKIPVMVAVSDLKFISNLIQGINKSNYSLVVFKNVENIVSQFISFINKSL